jgi:uncharacterized protein YbaR (Trm112 family)
MAIDKKLLEILRCPITKQPLKLLDSTHLETLNRLISEGEMCWADGTAVTEPITEALVTDNQTTIYEVEDGIPVMLEDRSLAADLIFSQ